MPNPIDVITKPLQIGAQVAFGAIEEVQKRFGARHPEEPPQPPEESQRPAGQGQRRQPRPKPLDDVTVTRKVETILFRQESVDKGKITVNTAKGVVTLRGEARTPELIKALEAMTREVPEVRDVENLLHLPKTPARRPRRPKETPKPTAKRTTAERPPTTPAAEPSPKEMAERGEGRKPAPLGANDNGAPS
jgi:hypothetical protein